MFIPILWKRKQEKSWLVNGRARIQNQVGLIQSLADFAAMSGEWHLLSKDFWYCKG